MSFNNPEYYVSVAKNHQTGDWDVDVRWKRQTLNEWSFDTKQEAIEHAKDVFNGQVELGSVGVVTLLEEIQIHKANGELQRTIGRDQRVPRSEFSIATTTKERFDL